MPGQRKSNAKEATGEDWMKSVKNPFNYFQKQSAYVIAAIKDVYLKNTPGQPGREDTDEESEAGDNVPLTQTSSVNEYDRVVGGKTWSENGQEGLKKDFSRVCKIIKRHNILSIIVGVSIIIGVSSECLQ